MYVEYLTSSWDRVYIREEYEEKVRRGFEQGYFKTINDLEERYPDAVDSERDIEPSTFGEHLTPEENRGNATLTMTDEEGTIDNSEGAVF